MVFNKLKYPQNWRSISLRVRSNHNHTCQFCLKPKSRKNPLTVHHLDLDTFNSSVNNLVLLHSSCHLLFHTVFKSCKIMSVFIEICRNFQSQTKFSFIKEFEDNETSSRFIRHKIISSYRRQKCSQNSQAVNSSLSLLQQSLMFLSPPAK